MIVLEQQPHESLLRFSINGFGRNDTHFAFLPTSHLPLRLIFRPNVNTEGQFLGVLLEVHDPNSVTLPDVDQIMQLMHCSRAEARVAALLSELEDVEQIAERLQLSVHTVRGHVKALLRKNAFKKQADFVVFLLRCSV